MAQKENKWKAEFNRVGYQTIQKRNAPTESSEGMPPSNWLILLTGVVEGPVRLLFSFINQFFTAASALPVVGWLFKLIAFLVMPVVRIAMMAILTITSPGEYIVKPFIQYLRYNVVMSRAEGPSMLGRAQFGAKAAWAIILLMVFLAVATLVIFSVATGGLGPLAMIGFGAVSAGISTAMGILGLGLAGQIALTTVSLLLVGGLLRHFLKPIAFLKFLAGKNDLEYGLRGDQREGDYGYHQDPESLGEMGQFFNREGVDKMERIKSFIRLAKGQWASVSEKDRSLGLKGGFYRYVNSVFEYSDRGSDSHAQSTVTFPAGQNPEYVDAVQPPRSPASAVSSGQLTSPPSSVPLANALPSANKLTIADAAAKLLIDSLISGLPLGESKVVEVKKGESLAQHLPVGFYSCQYVQPPESTSSGKTTLEWRPKGDFSHSAADRQMGVFITRQDSTYTVSCSHHDYKNQSWGRALPVGVHHMDDDGRGHDSDGNPMSPFAAGKTQ